MTPKKILAFAIGPIGAALISLITLPFVAWFFTVEDVGRLTMLQVMLGLSASLFSLGMNQAYVREYHEEEDSPALFKTAALPGVIFLLMAMILALVQPFSVSTILFGLDSAALTVYLALAIAATFFIFFLGHVLRMQERGLAFSATQIAPKALLLLLIGAVLVFDLPAEFHTLMLMSTLAILVSFAAFVLLTRDTWIPAIGRRIQPHLLKKMLAFSLPLVIGGLAYWGLTTLDRFFLRQYAGFHELGVYAMSASLAGAVAVLSVIFSNVWHPVVYKWAKNGIDPQKVQQVVESALLVVALIWSLFGTLSWLLLYFLPEEYRAVEYLIVACVAGPLLYVLSETTVVGIGITRKSGYAMLASLAALIVSVTLNILFIPQYGAAAAALSSALAFLIFFTVRTECSAFLWHGMPRIKIYLSLLAYTAVTFVTVVYQADFPFAKIIWPGLFLMVCILFWVRIKEIFLFVRARFSGI